MANETLTNIFSDIADAVRAKGVTGQMTPLQMPTKIADIPSGGNDVKLFEANLELDFTGLTAIPSQTFSPSVDKGKFQGWTNIKSVSFPDLSSVGSNGCRQMFYGCTSLTTAPATLPATTLASNCYNGMFQGCSSLTTAPSLPATTLAEGCYDSMFQNCTSLTTAPSLPATTLASGCYDGMFWNCTSLATAPSLPATTLADKCYYGMFTGCKSLTGTITITVSNTNTTIPASAFQSMFQRCSNLTKVILDFSTFSSIPTMISESTVNVFNSTTDTRLEIHVPESLEASWKKSANWSTWESFIIGV